MSWAVAAPLIGAGVSALGQYFGAKDQSEAQKETARINADVQRENVEKNIALQKEFATHGVRWKVEDAKAAGVHPLYAMGANTASFSPISVGSTEMPDMSTGQAMANMGQDIGRAIAATATAEDREVSSLRLASAKADVEGKLLDNQIRAAQLAKINQAGGNPAFPGSDNFLPGQGNSGLVKVDPAKRTASQPGRLAQEAGWRPDVSYARTDTGLTPMVPESLSESLEDDVIGKIMWRIRNQLVPNLSGGAQGAPPASQLPKGATGWDWSYSKQEWQPRYGAPVPVNRNWHMRR